MEEERVKMSRCFLSSRPNSVSTSKAKGIKCEIMCGAVLKWKPTFFRLICQSSAEEVRLAHPTDGSNYLGVDGSHTFSKWSASLADG